MNTNFVTLNKLTNAMHETASFDELYDICNEYRALNISSDDILDVVLEHSKKFMISDSYDNLLYELMSALGGWVDLKYSLVGQGVRNIYLDDERVTPDTFFRTYSPSETINMLKDNKPVNVLSLDHDLGDDSGIGTGYDVLKWIEKQVYLNPDYIPPARIVVHSANPPARRKMNAAIENINRKIQSRNNNDRNNKN